MNCSFLISPTYCVFRRQLLSYCKSVKLWRQLSNNSNVTPPSGKIDLSEVVEKLYKDDSSLHHQNERHPEENLLLSMQQDITSSPKYQSAPWLHLNQFTVEKSNPMQHVTQDVSKFYPISSEDQKRFFPTTINSILREQMETFQAFRLMIREPAVEIMEILKQYNLQNPMPRLLLFGKRGCGKTTSLAHIMHYCGRADYVIVHIPWVASWVTAQKQTVVSDTYENIINRPEDSINWLKYFLTLNGPVIKDMKLSKTYKWSKKESSEEGSPITTLLDFGIDRLMYSDDVVVALFEELNHHASQDRCKVLFAIDSVNMIWKTAYLKFKGEQSRQRFLLKQISIFDSIMKYISSNQKNSVLLCTVDVEINDKDDRNNCTPKYLLGKEGFNFMEPYIPIEVKEYTDEEFMNCLAYYNDRMWIQNPEAKTEDGTNQLKFLSNKQPFSLYTLCSYN